MMGQWAKDLSQLNDKIHSIMETLAKECNFSVNDQDARLIALNGMQRAALSCGFWINTYASIANINQDETDILRFAGSKISLKKTADIMLSHIKLSLIVFFHFKLENLLSSLVMKLKNKKVTSLGLLFKELVPYLDLSDVPRKSEIIKAFSSIRNSLHNNGIHNKTSFSIQCGRFNYEFIENEVVQCSSLEHCINILNEVTDIIYEIINSDKVLSEKDIIPDAFAEWSKNNNI